MMRHFIKIFVGLLCFSASLGIKCMSLNNDQCKTIPDPTDLDLVECNYYQFIISLQKYNANCNNLAEIYGKIYVPNKREDLNLNPHNLIIRKSESKTIKSICYENENVNKTLNNIIQIKFETALKILIFGILLNVKKQQTCKKYC